MSYTYPRVAFVQVLLVAASLAVAGCDDGGGTSSPDNAPGAGGKADETTAGPIGELGAGSMSSGYLAGDAVHVYVVKAREGSIVNARVERTDGDLDPTAFLYRGLSAAQADDYVRPTHGFENTSSAIEAGWEVPSSGDLLLIISAGSGTAGNFSVELTCHEESRVPCTSNGVEDEIGACEYVREAWAECYESDDPDGEACGPWNGIEDTTEEEDCCDLWEAEGLPGEDFCP